MRTGWSSRPSPEHLERALGWESIYAYNAETFGPAGTLGRASEREVVLVRDLGAADDELALFDLLFRESIGKADRERLKQASRALLASLRDLLRPMHDWTQNTATQAEVQVFILDNLWQSLPRPPFSDEETEAVASLVYDYVWQRSASGRDLVVV